VPNHATVYAKIDSSVPKRRAKKPKDDLTIAPHRAPESIDADSPKFPDWTSPDTQTGDAFGALIERQEYYQVLTVLHAHQEMKSFYEER
jgi:hypothetical protein